MGIRKDIHLTFEEIEKKHGRITKSMFVIPHWIMESKRFENMSRKFNNKDTLKYIWSHRNAAIDEMLKTGLFDIKIHKPSENRGLWLYILHIEREGMEVNLAIPYPTYKKTINIHHSELEETDINKDSLTLNGTRCFYGKRFKLGFIIENIDKSRNKLIEKMNEVEYGDK